MDLGLSGKKVIMNGGAHGIGLATVQLLTAEGADVAFFSRQQDRIDAALATVTGNPGKAHGTTFDMTGNPLLVLGAMLCIVSVQLFSVGLLGEANTRLYYRRNERRPFAIRSVVHSENSAPNSTAPATIPMKKAA